MSADISHLFGEPLSFSATGDLLAAVGTEYTQQRVLRRLLSAPGATPFHPEYGGGLPAMVGNPANGLQIGGTIRRQMRLEARVARQPAPSVSVSVLPTGTVTATVAYVDASTGQSTVTSV